MKSVNLNKLRYDGVEAAKRGDIQIALDSFEKILNLSQTPSSSDYTNAGMAQRINGDFQRAKKYFESALKINSSNRNAAKNLVLCLLDLNKPSEAIDFLEKILAKTGDSELRQLQFKSAFKYLSPIKAVKMLDSHLKNQMDTDSG